MHTEIPPHRPPGADNPLSRHPPGAGTPQADTPQSRHPLEQTPPRADTLPPQQMATVTDGTHPTGIHSCF